MQNQVMAFRVRPQVVAFRINMADDQLRDSRGRWTTGRFGSGKVRWDPRDGIGSVPMNQEVAYRGFVKGMYPEQFRRLVPAGVSGRDTKEFIKKALVEGKALGQPFLTVAWKEDEKAWQVLDHEGRSRSDAIHEVFPNDRMPVHIFPQGLRARDLTKEMLTAPFLKQQTGLFEHVKNNAIDEKGDEGRWVTMHGTPVFIKDGEDPKDAMSRTFDKDKPRGLDREKPKEPGAFKRWFKEAVQDFKDYYRLGKGKPGQDTPQVKLPRAIPVAGKKLQRISDVPLGAKETLAERHFPKQVEAVYNGSTTPAKMVDALMKSGQIKPGSEQPSVVRERAIKDFEKAVMIREQKAEEGLRPGAGKLAYTDKAERATLSKGETLAERHWSGHIDQLMDGKMSITSKVDELIGKGELGFQRGDKGYTKMRETAIKDFTRAVNRRENVDRKMEKASAPKKSSRRSGDKGDGFFDMDEESMKKELASFRQNAFDPNQPRDKDGKWTGGSSLSFSNEPEAIGSFTRGSAIRRSTIYSSADWNAKTERHTWHNPDGTEVTDAAMLERIAQVQGSKATAAAYKGAWINPNLESPLLAIAFDQKDRKHYIYDEAFQDGNAEHKWKIVEEMQKAVPAMRTQAAADRKAGVVEAFLLKLEDMTCIRVGSDKDTQADVKAYGLTTLEGRHAEVNGDRVTLKFTAKQGEPGEYTLKDRQLAQFIAARKEQAGDTGKLWGDTSASKFNAYLKQIAPDTEDITAHKFRHFHATRIAGDIVEEYAGRTLSPKEFESVQKRACEAAAAHLSNTWQVTRERYVAPTVWGRLTVSA